MKQITRVRKAVCTIANELKKAGYSLSQAFRKAWRQVKLTMTIRTAGTTFKNRQERLQFLKQFRSEDLDVITTPYYTVTLKYSQLRAKAETAHSVKPSLPLLFFFDISSLLNTQPGGSTSKNL
ncbi:hypothetical protein AALA00_07660 [Lachnospiraceae bacterium 46-15]